MHRKTITDFYVLGLLYGDTLRFIKDENVTVVVVSSNKVRHNGKDYSLSAITNLLINGTTETMPSMHNGWDYWLFNSRTMNDRRKLYSKHNTIRKMQEIKNKS